MSEAKDPAPKSPFVIDSDEWRRDLGSYRMVVELEDYPAYEAVLANLSGPINEHNLAAMRMSRHGGPNPADFAFQQVLFTLVGAITVAAGHVEAEMKRILLVAADGAKTTFADVDLTWSGLEDALWKVAQSEGDLSDRLRPVLEWGKEHNIKHARHTAVHSAWRLYEIGHFEASRFKHKSDGASIIDTGERLGQWAENLLEYRNRLENVVTWPLAVLPPLPGVAPMTSVQMTPWVATPDQAT